MRRAARRLAHGSRGRPRQAAGVDAQIATLEKARAGFRRTQRWIVTERLLDPGEMVAARRW
jgi:hypothetical protein